MATEQDGNYGTFTRTHPATGRTQTRVAESAGDAVHLKFIGWREVGKSAAPKTVDVKPTDKP